MSGRRFVFLRTEGLKSLKLIGFVLLGKPILLPLMALRFALWGVKTRTGVQKGFPSEAVNVKKRDRYEKIAACYLQTYHKTELYVRFDVISILVLSDNHAFLRLHTNAFSCDH